tara:strand:+ start:166 stop:876 length:711 start_codon:yes stop_codon:yes gene_type:complete
MKIRVVKENVNELMGPDPRKDSTYKLNTNSMDAVQNILMVVGFVPGFGNIADITNAFISGARGRWLEAFIMMLAALPMGGVIAVPAYRALRRGGKPAALRVLKEVMKKTFFNPNWNRQMASKSSVWFKTKQVRVVRLAWKSSGNKQFVKEVFKLWYSIDLWWQLTLASGVIAGITVEAFIEEMQKNRAIAQARALLDSNAKLEKLVSEDPKMSKNLGFSEKEPSEEELYKSLGMPT